MRVIDRLFNTVQMTGERYKTRSKQTSKEETAGVRGGGDIRDLNQGSSSSSQRN